MSKYQEALDELYEGYQYGMAGRHYKDILQELIDKEKPMKPIRYNTNQYKCPKCLNQIKGQKWLYNMETKRFDIKFKIKPTKIYCPYCNQKLDWGDECE